MSFDKRYSLYEKISHQANYGIPADNIGVLKTKAGYAEQMKMVPKEFQGLWTKADAFLSGDYGTNVDYRTEIKESPTSWKTKRVKRVGRYSSNPILRRLKETRSKLSEQDIANEIYIVDEGCDLKGTTVKSFPNLRHVHGTLTIDADSPLEDLRALKSAGKIDVIAKNLKEMDKFLIKLGIMSPDGKILVNVADDIYLFMKTYL